MRMKKIEKEASPFIPGERTITGTVCSSRKGRDNGKYPPRMHHERTMAKPETPKILHEVTPPAISHFKGTR
jgi:hypothetical protein